MGAQNDVEKLRSSAFQFIDQFPQLKGPYLEYLENVYKPGVLDSKTKRLIALGAGLLAGRQGCILGHTDKAIQLGATREEILEACTVAMAVGGTGVWATIPLVLEYLKDAGMME